MILKSGPKAVDDIHGRHGEVVEWSWLPRFVLSLEDGRILGFSFSFLGVLSPGHDETARVRWQRC